MMPAAATLALLALLQAAGGMTIPPPSPEMLPGDHGPLPLAMMLAPPHGGPPPPSSGPVAAPSPEAAIAAARTALASCEARHVLLGVAVTDARGNLVAALTAAHAGPGHVFVAARKATAAAAYREPTSDVQTRLRHQDPAALAMLKPYMAVSPGAVPIMVSGKLIGAIGASGGSGIDDETCAAAGAIAAQRLSAGGSSQ